MAVTSVIPGPGLINFLTIGGTPQIAVGANPQGGYITNPLTAVDQGLAEGAAPEPLFIDPTGADATTKANGTTFRIEAGGTWFLIPGQTTTTSVNAASANHKFSIVVLGASS
jgi:hypothetical protein